MYSHGFSICLILKLLVYLSTEEWMKPIPVYETKDKQNLSHNLRGRFLKKKQVLLIKETTNMKKEGIGIQYNYY